MDKSLFPTRLKTLRLARDLHQYELAERVGVSRERVGLWERGVKGISGDNLTKLCEALGVTLAEFWDPDYMPGRQQGLPLGEAQTTLDRAIGELPTDIRNDKRAVSCPRCKRSGFGEKANYCPICAFPLYNFCATEARHINDPAARYCETCGVRTYWSMSANELEAHGVPPYRGQQRNGIVHNTQLAPGRR